MPIVKLADQYRESGFNKSAIAQGDIIRVTAPISVEISRGTDAGHMATLDNVELYVYHYPGSNEYAEAAAIPFGMEDDDLDSLAYAKENTFFIGALLDSGNYEIIN